MHDSYLPHFPVEFENSGAIFLGLQRSTMDDPSMRFVRTWLGSHSHNDTPVDSDGRYTDQPVVAEQDNLDGVLGIL